MNVFVLGPGRCGSTTFIRACGHITNYTAGHETGCYRLGPERLDFPPHHIEAGWRLTWFLGRLDEAYGDRAFYVHLARDPEAAARSWAQRFFLSGGMAPAYRNAILGDAIYRRGISRRDAAIDYIATVEANIRHFLKDKNHVFPFAVERAEEDFSRFWEWIGAHGDRDAALAEWRTRHNSGDSWRGFRRHVRHAARRTWRAAFPPK